MTTLKIDSVEVANQAALQFSQTYSDVQAVDFRRTADGSGVLRSTGTSKLQTTITGRGWMPAGLATLDRTASHVIECATPDGVTASGTSVAIPANRRNDVDHMPLGFAQVNGSLQRTTITNLAALNAGTEDTATLTAVSGADLYQVNYWPKITAAITRLSETVDESGNFTWTLEAEEI